MADWNRIGRALGGFAAGYAGDGPQYVAALQRADQAKMIEEERKRKESQERQQSTEQRTANQIRMARQRMEQNPVAALPLINEMMMGIPGAERSPLGQIKQSILASQTTGVVAPGQKQQILGQAAQQLRALEDSFVAQGLLQPEQPKEPPKPVSLARGSQLVNPETGEVVAENQEPIDPNKLLNPDGSINENYVRARARIAQAGRPETTVSVNTAEDYFSARAGDQAASMGELEKAANSAYRQNMALDRFISSSAKGDEGGFQPVITGLKNFISSFGFDPEGLTETTAMEAAVSDILQNKMSEMGARGLTDEDMKILKNALPRVNTSRESREVIARLVKKANENTIQEYRSRAEWEDSRNPGMEMYRPSWLQSWEPSDGRILPQFQPVPTTEPNGTIADDEYGRAIQVKNGRWELM